MPNDIEEKDLKEVDEKKKRDHGAERAEDSRPIVFSNLNDEERAAREKEILDDLMKRFDSWEAWRNTYETTWDSIYRMYVNQITASKTPTRSKISVPVVFQIIESALPKIVNAIFSQDESFFEVIPFNEDEDVEGEMIHMLLEYQLARANFFVKFLDFSKQLLLYGTSYFKVYWKTKRDWVWDRKPVRKNKNILGFLLGEKIEWEDTKEYKIVERRPEVDFIDILDVFPDPEARVNHSDEPDVFIRSWSDTTTLKEMGKGPFPVYANTDREDIKGDKDSFAESRSLRSSARGEGSKGNIRTGKSVELLEFWGRYDVDGDGIREHALITIANRKVIVQAKPNPFYHQKSPLVRTVLFPVPGEWFGIGLVEPIMSLKHELDTLRRQRLDNVNQVLNAMWKVNTMADVDTETLFSAPNNIVLTDDMSAVEKLDGQDVTGSAYTEAQVVQSDIENTTTPRSVQGTPESGRLGRTARGAQLIIGQALEKFGLSNKLIEEMGVKKVLSLFHQLNLQMIDSEDILRNPGLYGHLFDEVTPEDIRADVQFKMIGVSEMIGGEAKINQLISVLGIGGKVISPNSWQMLLRRIYKLQDSLRVRSKCWECSHRKALSLIPQSRVLYKALLRIKAHRLLP